MRWFSCHELPLELDSTARRLIRCRRVRSVAPYEKDPTRWLGLPWINCYSARSVAVTTDGRVGGVGHLLAKLSNRLA